jgi:hypothetical protein
LYLPQWAVAQSQSLMTETTRVWISQVDSESQEQFNARRMRWSRISITSLPQRGGAQRIEAQAATRTAEKAYAIATQALSDGSVRTRSQRRRCGVDARAVNKARPCTITLSSGDLEEP